MWTRLLADITNIGYLIVGFIIMLLIEMAVEIGRSIIWTEKHDRNLREKLKAKLIGQSWPDVKYRRFPLVSIKILSRSRRCFFDSC